MLRSRSHIIETIKTVATALGDLNEQVVYVGGAVAGLYADDAGAPEVRPTKDIDIVLEIVSLAGLENVRQQLAARNILVASQETVMCRYSYHSILIDVMSTQEVGWAPANPWFKAGFSQPEIRNIDEVAIRILPLPYYLASKFTAFRNRGTDPRTSPDFEDIVYILDNRTTLITDILHAETEVKTFLVAELTAILQDSGRQEALLSHLEPATQTRRFAMLNQKLKAIIG